MINKRFEDIEKTIIFPDTLVFIDNMGDKYRIRTNEVELNPVWNSYSEIIVAINVRVNISGHGTITNNIVFNTEINHFEGKLVANIVAYIGFYGENSKDYNHPDDCSYDTYMIIDQETLNEIIVIYK